MCDTIAGELLVSHHKDDPAGISLIRKMRDRHENFEHIEWLESLDHRLERIGLRARDDLALSFHRLRVPKGDELFKANMLQFLYKHEMQEAIDTGRMDINEKHREIFIRSQHHLQVVPHSLLSTAFTFEQPRHDDYKKLFNWMGPSSSRKDILVVDSGLEHSSWITPASQRNFVDPANSSDVDDDHPRQHGTAIAEIIHDLCPQARLHIHKVVDASDRASEWDTLAALAAKSGATIVNMSLAFGLKPYQCAICGRESHASRSAVFEAMLLALQQSTPEPIIVAAAGNQGLPELAFPARFDSVVAVASVDQSLNLSQFSNRSTKGHYGQPHPNVFVLPGGNQLLTPGNAPIEWLGNSSNGDQLCGTSFAAAYASGLIAHLWDEPAHRGKNAKQLLQWMASHADQSLPSYNRSTHGNGLMRV